MNKEQANKVVFVGPFEEHAGYSSMNRKYVKELHTRGWNMGVETMRCNFEITKEEAAFYHALRNRNDRGLPILFHSDKKEENDKIVKIQCWLPLANIPKYKHNITYTMMESRLVASNMVNVINTFYNSCWVPTQYYVDAFKESGVKIPVHLVPVGVDEMFKRKNINPNAKFNFKVFQKSKPMRTGGKPQGFRFIAVFRWTYRKGFDALIKAYLREFKDSDNVSLVIVSRHVISSFRKDVYEAVQRDIETCVNKYGNKEDCPPVYWCSDNIATNDMPSIYHHGDCFVLPSRGEGVCLPALEASAMELPTILPYHTGFTDYVSDETCYKVDVDEWEVCDNKKPGWQGWATRQFVGQQFAKMGDKAVEQISSHMRSVYEDYEAGKKKNEKMREVINNKFYWPKCIDRAEERLTEILQP